MKVSGVLAIVQVRLGSTRLPRKALLEIAGRPMVEHVVARARAVPGVDRVVLATTASPDDDALADFAGTAGVPCVRGSVDDVLDRFRAVLLAHPAAAILRITGDCPLLDPAVSGLVVDRFLRAAPPCDYVSNVEPRATYPDGLDTEVFSADALDRAWRHARLPSHREHVTPYIRTGEGFRRDSVEHDRDLSAHRWTVDEPRDLEFVRAVYEALAPDGARVFGMTEVLDLLRRRPELSSLNAGIQRNAGYARSVLADRSAIERRAP